MYLILYRPVARDLIRIETKYSFEKKADQFKWHKLDKLDNLKKWLNLKKAEQKMLMQKILTPFEPLCFNMQSMERLGKCNYISQGDLSNVVQTPSSYWSNRGFSLEHDFEVLMTVVCNKQFLAKENERKKFSTEKLKFLKKNEPVYIHLKCLNKLVKSWRRVFDNIFSLPLSKYVLEQTEENEAASTDKLFTAWKERSCQSWRSYCVWNFLQDCV